MTAGLASTRALMRWKASSSVISARRGGAMETVGISQASAPSSTSAARAFSSARSSSSSR